MTGIAAAAESIVGLILQYRYVIGNEVEFQEGLARVFDLNSMLYIREHDLGAAFGRIDFFLPGACIGIELKVKGNPTAVLRQLHRYALSPKIGSLILVTGRARLAAAPPALNGKPLLTAAVWPGQF